MSLNFVDTFAGVGGFHIGIKNVLPDAQCALAVEWDKDAQYSYSENFPETPIFGDITELTEIPDHDLLTGGFPCQPFSFNKQSSTKKVYDEFMDNKSSKDKKTLFLELLTRSAETPRTKFEHVYFLSRADILLLPTVTDYMVGALCITQHDNTTITMDTDVVSDFGYNECMGRFILQDYKYFIILRHLDGECGHFDYFLGLRNHKGIFEKDSVEAEYIFSLCNEKVRYMLTGAGEIQETKKKPLSDWVEEMKAKYTSQMVY